MEVTTIILSALALFFSCYTFFAHDRRLKKQEAQINELSLQEAEDRVLNKKKAKISGHIIYHGKGSNDLYITNNGESEARNVRVEVLDESDKGCIWNNKTIFIQQLTSGNTYQFHFVTDSGASTEIHFQYTWDDDFSAANEYQEYLQRR